MTEKVLNPTLIGALWPAEDSRSHVLRDLVLIGVGSLLMALLAQIEVPFWPVPMTMQTYGVLMIGMAYGARLASATVLLYLLEGASGLPVLAGGAAGPQHFMGPTGGYLVGFLLAAAALGWFADRGWGRSLPRLALALLLGACIPFITGLPWLAMVLGDFGKAITLGLTPFLAGEAMKLALAAATLPLAWSLVKRFRHL